MKKSNIFGNVGYQLNRESMSKIHGGLVEAGCGKCKVQNPTTHKYDNCYAGDQPGLCLCLWRGAGTGC